MGSQSQTGLCVHTHTYTHALTSQVSAVILLWPLHSRLSSFWTSFRWTVKFQEEEGDTWVLRISRDFSPISLLSFLHVSIILASYLLIFSVWWETYREHTETPIALALHFAVSTIKRKKKKWTSCPQWFQVQNSACFNCLPLDQFTGMRYSVPLL